MKLKSLVVFFLLTLVISCNAQTSKNIKTIDALAFAEKINTTKNPQILDVRTPEEFNLEHIENAVNENWFASDFAKNVEKLDKNKAVFVYCKSGGRSKKATEKLAELGFKNIYELEGGFLKWDAAGLTKPNDKIIGMSNQEYEVLLNSDKKVLIDFYAEWCAPCKLMTPYLLKMQNNLKDKVTIIRLDADEHKTLLKNLKISTLPTLLLYESKELKWSHSGYISETDLSKQLN
ncbi:thioredoxin domain-containing protein [Flavobacterium flavipallidum]|uniref:Thioredoxin domain-containing protein n=1 Tax=Flavobacterium flavipallidum TaxID=3139140 RepID=A0ABU9HQI2_9FLAO